MKGLGVTSMILGIIAIVLVVFSCGFLAPISVILAIVGVILGGIALGKYKVATDKSGKGMATAGVVLSIIVLAITIILIIAVGGTFTALLGGA